MATTPTAHERGTAWSVSDAVLVLLGAQLLSLLWAAGLVGVLHPDGLPDQIPTTSQVLLNVGLWLGYGLGPVLMARHRATEATGFAAPARTFDLPVGLAVGVVLQLLVLPVRYAPLLRFVDGDPAEPAERLIDAVDGPFDAVLLVGAVVVVAPCHLVRVVRACWVKIKSK